MENVSEIHVSIVYNWLLLFEETKDNFGHSFFYYYYLCLAVQSLTTRLIVLFNNYDSIQSFSCINTITHTNMFELQKNVWILKSVSKKAPKTNTYWLGYCFFQIYHQTLGSVLLLLFCTLHNKFLSPKY